MFTSNMQKLIALTALWFCGLMAAGQFSKLAVPFDDVVRIYGSQAGWLLSIVSAMGALLGLLAGSAITRLGAMRLLIIALFMGAICSFFQSSLPNFWLFWFSRLVEGITHLVIVIAAPSLMVEICPKSWQTAAMTIWSTFFGVTFALTIWILNHFTMLVLDQVLFWHGALMMSLGVIMAIAQFNNRKTSIAGPSHHDESQWIEFTRDQKRALTSPRIMTPAMAWLFYAMTYVAVLAIAPPLMSDNERLWISPLLPLIGIFSSLMIAGSLLGKIPALKVVQLGFAGCAIMVMCHFLGVSFGVSVLLAFFPLGLIQAGSFAMIPQLNATTKTRTLAYGLLAQAGNTGNLIGTPLLLGLTHTIGQIAVVYYILLICIAALAILTIMRKKIMNNPN